MASEACDTLLAGWQTDATQEWEALLDRGKAIGFSRTLQPVDGIVKELHRKRQTRNHENTVAAGELGQLCVYLRLTDSL